MSDRPRTPLDTALEYCVYAPLGFALEARTLLPRFVDRGRNQIVLTKVIGKYAVRKGSEAAEGVLGQVPTPAADLLRMVGLLPDDPDPPSDHEDARSPVTGAPPPAAETGSDEADSDEAPAAPPFAPDELAIPGYDALSASQVVPRLDGLGAEELERVRAYEQATRGRKTILSKIAQLQSA